MFSCESFVTSSLTFRSLIHFEFISVYSIREFSNFILLQVFVQSSQHHLLKRLCFLHCIFLKAVTISDILGIFHCFICLCREVKDNITNFT